jgi:hypothetical protein
MGLSVKEFETASLVFEHVYTRVQHLQKHAYQKASKLGMNSLTLSTNVSKHIQSMILNDLTCRWTDNDCSLDPSSSYHYSNRL